MMKDMLVEVVFPLVVIVAIVFGAIVGIGCVVEKNYCDTMQEISPQYSFL